ncbi:hypothetical protein [Endozoicomonas euniceicola]|uniref:Uncharacterized protein n=1 Tax=Endozoicomonas euniceicola TaxID=1234143 RepID=A0ABY6GV14_9GAMM|nr:hypothetical protein [Endozoicomonas euniceicola]UYM16612.1 hypothetical protein NX720_01380 [Endozoicomonas euniceicola]
MQLTIIFITACFISPFSYATQCQKCNKEANNCRCVRTVADLQNTTRCTHHADSNEIPSLDPPDNQTLPAKDNSRAIRQVAGSLIIVPDIKGAGVTFTVGSPSARATTSSSHGCRINRKKEKRQPFTGRGCSLQTPSSQNSGESAEHSDILGIIDQLSNLQINTATGEQAQILTVINNAFTAALNLQNQADGQQARDSLLNETLQTAGYQLSTVEIAATNNAVRQIRTLMASGSITYLASGSEHYIFIPDISGGILMMSYFFQHPSNPEYQNIIRHGASQTLSTIKPSKLEHARLYIIETPEASHQSI